MTPLAPHLAAFFGKRLPIERRASANTCDTYAYAFQLLLEFAVRRLGTAPSELSLEQLDVPLIVDFLDSLQTERGNGPRTRNSRLAAIRSFMRFVEHRVPSALDQVRRVLAISSQKTDTPLIRNLDAEEQRAILEAPEPRTRLGIRDRAMLLLALAGGLRASELVGLRLEEVNFDGRYINVRVRGKGRRERLLTLWKSVADAVRAWIAVRGAAAAPELFLNASSRAMSRSGLQKVLRKYVGKTVVRCPSLLGKRVSPHVLRHTCAMNVLRATRDIRKVSLWLGHASTQTTDMYLQGDPTEKLQALAAIKLPSLRPGKFKLPDRLIDSLKSPMIMRSDPVGP